MTTIEDERVCTELSMTLGVSFRIKCVVAAPHATWPRGACWSVGLIAWPLGFPLFFSFLGLVFKLSSPSHFPISLFIGFEFFFSPPFTLAIVPTLFLRYPLDFSPIELLSDCAAYFQGMFFFPSPFISFFFISYYKFMIFPFSLLCCGCFWFFWAFRIQPLLSFSWSVTLRLW